MLIISLNRRELEARGVRYYRKGSCLYSSARGVRFEVRVGRRTKGHEHNRQNIPLLSNHPDVEEKEGQGPVGEAVVEGCVRVDSARLAVASFCCSPSCLIASNAEIKIEARTTATIRERQACNTAKGFGHQM